MSQPPQTILSSFSSGTNSLMSGERPSVRLPRRMVPSCVSEPVGCATPFRTSSTPAIKVVLTAPMPGVRTPSLPLGGAILAGRRMRRILDSYGLGLLKARQAVRRGPLIRGGTSKPHKYAARESKAHYDARSGEDLQRGRERRNAETPRKSGAKRRVQRKGQNRSQRRRKTKLRRRRREID